MILVNIIIPWNEYGRRLSLVIKICYLISFVFVLFVN